LGWEFPGSHNMQLKEILGGREPGGKIHKFKGGAFVRQRRGKGVPRPRIGKRNSTGSFPMGVP